MTEEVRFNFQTSESRYIDIDSIDYSKYFIIRKSGVPSETNIKSRIIDYLREIKNIDLDNLEIRHIHIYLPMENQTMFLFASEVTN